MCHSLLTSTCTRSYEGTARTAGQRDIPHHRTSCPVNKLRGFAQVLPIAVRGWVGHQAVCGEQFLCAALVFLGFYSSHTLLLIAVVAAIIIVVIITIHFCFKC